MLKIIFILLFLGLTTATSQTHAADVSKMSPLVRRLAIAARDGRNARGVMAVHARSGGALCAFVRSTGDTDSLFAANGCRVLAREGDISIVDIPTARLGKLSEAPEVIRIEASLRNSTAMDSMAIHLNAVAAYEGKALPQAYTGRGVVMGIQDVGFDLTHPNFYDATGTSYRIKGFWDQIDNSTEGAEMYVGRAYEGSDAILAKAHSRDGKKLFHGTLTLGIAAGSGYDTKYRGMAYESDLCLVSNAVSDDAEFIAEDDIYKYTYATDALGFKYIFDYAEAMGQPCVISFSEGSSQDFEGYDVLYYEMLDRLMGPGRIIVSSAGNAGGVRNYIEKPSGEASAGTFVRYWHHNMMRFTMKSADDFDIRMVIYGSQNDTISVATADLKAAEDSTMVIERTVNDTNYTFDLMAFESCYNPNETVYEVYVAGPLHIGVHTPISVEMVGAGAHVEFYRGSCEMCENNRNPELCHGDNSHGINSPSSAPRVICVGATSYRTSYVNSDGATQTYDCGTNCEWAYYSSMGPTYDNRTKPDVLAPGTNILTSTSFFYNEANPDDRDGIVSHSDFNGRSYAWRACSGTSMSSPAAAGIIAMWLQARPDMTPEDVMGVIERTSTRYDDMLSVPDNRYGYGQIDAYAGLLDILGVDAIEGLSRHNPTTLHVWSVPGKQLNIECDAPLAHTTTIRIYSTTGATMLTTSMAAGENRTTLNLAQLPKGVYVVQTNSGERGATGSTLVRID